MNLPNKLTMFRVILIPVMVVIAYIPYFEKEINLPGDTLISVASIIALAIFAVAALTDMLDGQIARKYNLVTDFGKFMDPLADKLLVMSSMIILLEWGLIPAWAVIIILAREFAVTGIRLIAASGGKVIAASGLGKIKTITQFAMIIVLFMNNYPFEVINVPADMILIVIAVALTVLSGVDYMYKNRSVISDM